jgi:hypothetical protein
LIEVKHAITIKASLAQQQAEAIALQANLAKKEAEAIANQERAIALQERQKKLQERQKKERLVAYLRSIGINPDEIP